jgi:hypothetical protein
LAAIHAIPVIPVGIRAWGVGTLVGGIVTHLDQDGLASGGKRHTQNKRQHSRDKTEISRYLVNPHDFPLLLCWL